MGRPIGESLDSAGYWLRRRFKRFLIPQLRRWRGFPANLRGAIWLLLSAILFMAMAIQVRILTQTYDVFQVAFFRSFVGAVFVIPFMLRAGVQSFRTKQPMLQLVRAFFAATAIAANYYALKNLLLVDANAISFARTLFLVPLAILFLGEKVGARRLGATIVGFIGVLIVLRPSGAVEPAAFAALYGALAIGISAVTVKFLMRTDSLATMLFYSGWAGLLVLTVPAILAWQTPTPMDLVALLVAGGLGVIAQAVFIQAYAIGEATAIGPVDYTRLIFAGVAGYFVFFDIPDMWSVVGAIVIAASTLYITRREAQMARAEAAPKVPQDIERL